MSQRLEELTDLVSDDNPDNINLELYREICGELLIMVNYLTAELLERKQEEILAFVN